MEKSEFKHTDLPRMEPNKEKPRSGDYRKYKVRVSVRTIDKTKNETINKDVMEKVFSGVNNPRLEKYFESFNAFQMMIEYLQREKEKLEKQNKTLAVDGKFEVARIVKEGEIPPATISYWRSLD